MLFVCYPGCSTCKKARDWLDRKGIIYTFRDIKNDNPREEELAAWSKKSGLPIRRLFNTSGLVYRALKLKDKLDGMPEKEQLVLLATDGMLVKRPILAGDDFVLVGFREKAWAEAFGAL